MAVKTILRGGGSMTRVDLTKAQCAELANYLRGILNNGVCAGSFDKIEMLVLTHRALAAAEELPEMPSAAAHAPAARKTKPEDAQRRRRTRPGSTEAEAGRCLGGQLSGFGGGAAEARHVGAADGLPAEGWPEQSGAAGSGLRQGG